MLLLEAIASEAGVLIWFLLLLVLVLLAVMLLSLSMFYAFWKQQGKMWSATSTTNALAPPTLGAVSSQVGEGSSDHEYFLLPFQLISEKRIPNATRKKRLSPNQLQRKVRSAQSEWQENGQLSTFNVLALEVLFDGSGRWFTLEQTLQTLQPRSDQLSEYEQQTLKAIQRIPTEKDATIREDLCCAVLVLCAIMRPHFSAQPEQQAAMDFVMGFACASVAKDLNLLSLAKQYYTNAERFFGEQQSLISYLHPYALTQISLGDMFFAHSLLDEKNKGHNLQWALDWYTKAEALYKQIPSIAAQSEHILLDEIEKRIKRAEEQFSNVQTRV